MEDFPDELNSIDLAQMEAASYESQARQLENKILNVRKSNLQLQIELLSAKMLLLDNDIVAKLNVHKNKAGNHKKFVAELCKRYGIEESTPFGYDPITGKLHIQGNE